MIVPPATATSESPVVVPYDDVTAFTRKLIHDVRNGLNALDLQLASVLDIAAEDHAELREDLMVARRLLSDEARRLASLSAQLRQSAPEMIDYDVSDLVEDLRGRVERSLKPNTQVNWSVETGREQVTVDFEFLSTAMLELVRNAMHFR
ncbi:MAG TPA: hypothetical protein VF593_09830, partial [Chthoniobacteraceae bacterium]